MCVSWEDIIHIRERKIMGLMCIDTFASFAICSRVLVDLSREFSLLRGASIWTQGEFVIDCITENIEYCYAFGFLLSRLEHMLAMKYAKRNYEIKKGNV